MKTLIYFLLTIFVSGCTKNDDPENNVPPELIGKWKIVEIYSSDGSSASWKPHDSGQVYDLWFKNGGETIVSNMIENCQVGTFSISANDEIIINLPCSEKSTIPIVSLTNTNLVTNTTYIEYELTKYVKVTE